MTSRVHLATSEGSSGGLLYHGQGLPRRIAAIAGSSVSTVPWAREGSRFTLLFEQAAVILAREMPVLAAARIIGITDQRL